MGDTPAIFFIFILATGSFYVFLAFIPGLLLPELVGEADNPGPDRSFSLQVRNIASAAAHVDELQTAFDHIVIWSELRLQL